jgi:predicted O-methyltransferase YrrM
MVSSYEPAEWRNYKMDWRGDPHPDMEPLDTEIEVIDAGLRFLVDCGVLPHAEYDHDRFTAHRQAIRERFEIPWTGISPRMQRLIYAINAIATPGVMVAAGVFCGNTFINNAGAAVGPGAVYEADRLVGIEIDPREAARAERNVRTVDPDGRAEIIAADATRRLRDFEDVVDLLYIDADGSYLDIIRAAAGGALRGGSLVLAHNSVNMSAELAPYLDFVRNPQNSHASVNMCVDDQGLEVTVWKE